MIMYTYYLISALGPSFRRYLWWKRYLTVIQMVQFVIIMVYMTASLWTSCGYNKYVTKLIIFEAAFNFALFMNFYMKVYGLNSHLFTCGSFHYQDSEKVTNKVNSVKSE